MVDPKGKKDNNIRIRLKTLKAWTSVSISATATISSMTKGKKNSVNNKERHIKRATTTPERRSS